MGKAQKFAFFLCTTYADSVIPLLACSEKTLPFCISCRYTVIPVQTHMTVKQFLMQSSEILQLGFIANVQETVKALSQ